MTDSPNPGRHRASTRARQGRRSPVGPIVSSLSVLLAVGPVIWFMARDTSTVDDANPVQTVSENTRNTSGQSATDGSTSSDAPLSTFTKTLPNGVITTVAGTPAPPISTTGTPASGDTPVSAPTSVVSSAPVTGATTVTVSPTTPGSTTGGTKPRPTRTTTVTTQPTPSASRRPPAGGGGTSAAERQVLALTNAARHKQGCGALRLDGALVEAAGRHASDMAGRHYLDHTNPEGQDPGDRITAAGYRGSGWGENIAAGYDSAQKVFAAWMNSEGHRKNILDCTFTSIGIGYDAGQVKPQWGPGGWVQDFGRS